MWKGLVDDALIKMIRILILQNESANHGSKLLNGWAELISGTSHNLKMIKIDHYTYWLKCHELLFVTT